MSSVYLEESQREEFLAQAEILLEALQLDIEEFEENPTNFNKLRSFLKSIDRLILHAKLFDLEMIVTFCDMSKVVGFKLISCDKEEINLIAAGVLADTVDLIYRIVRAIGVGEDAKMTDDYSSFIGRLKILSQKFKAIESHTQKALSKKANELDDLILVLDGL